MSLHTDYDKISSGNLSVKSQLVSDEKYDARSFIFDMNTETSPAFPAYETKDTKCISVSGFSIQH